MESRPILFLFAPITDLVSAQLIVGDPNDAVQNRGDISITDENSLSVDFARTLVGTVSVTTEGSLIAANVQSEGVNQTDAISLRATGEGADVVTGRVVVRNQAGGIQLTADDDVRDSNLQDGLMVIADSFTVFAGNNSDDNFNGINSQSRVRSVSATVENGEAAILVDNTGFLSVNQATLSSGFVRINNRVGSVSINDIALSGSSSNNRVFVNTFADNADILVGRIDAGGGNVVLDSADDIFDTDLLDDLFVEGIFLLATSRNGNIGAFDGVVLDVDVDSFFADAQLSGQEFVRQRA